MGLNEKQVELCETNRWDFSDLRALFLSCTLKKSPELSHTEALLAVSQAIMERNGVTTETIRLVDYRIASGVYPDMTAHGWEYDDWPEIHAKVMAADILVLGTPIWLGEKSSVCTQAIERLYGMSGILNDQGQYAYYGRVGGCIIIGNEDGVKHCGMSILYALQHHPYGYVVHALDVPAAFLKAWRAGRVLADDGMALAVGPGYAGARGAEYCEYRDPVGRGKVHGAGVVGDGEFGVLNYIRQLFEVRLPGKGGGLAP